MSKYLFIESSDPFESRDCANLAETAKDLQSRGNEVTVLLIQNGVLAARHQARGSHAPGLVKAGITVLVDDFSLRERGISAAELSPGIKESSIDTIADALLEGTKTIWH